MRRVRVFFLGGTIAMTGTDGEPGTALRPDLDGADLLASLPLPDEVSVDAVDVAHVDSSALTFAVCLETLARADDAVRRGEADGVVVVQGTDTLEETAYLWDLLWRHTDPFVVTGAMRSADATDPDGPANLLAAVTTAAAEQASGLGVVAVVGSEVHAARHVTKGHTTALTAFRSPDVGPLGTVDGHGPVLTTTVVRIDPLALPTSTPPVALLRAALDDDPAAYRAVAALSDGMVVEAFGAGQVRPEVADVLAEAALDRPVVLVSRTGAGAVASQTYAGPGSGSDLLARGLVDGGALSGVKARVLLRVLLGGGASADEVVRAFGARGR